MELILFFLVSYVLSMTSSLSAVNKKQHNGEYMRNCSIYSDVVKAVYNGWPYKVSCRDLLKNVTLPDETYQYDDYYANDVSSSSYDYNCIIRDIDNNVEVFKKTAEQGIDFSNFYWFTSDFTKGSSKTYLLEGWISNFTEDCVASRYILRVEDNQKTCEAQPSEAKNRSIELGKSVSFSCSPPDIPMVGGETNYTVTWYKDCEELPQRETIFKSLNKGSTTYKIDKATFKDPGVYSCAITYNGKKRFVSYFRFCVSPKHQSVSHSVKCLKKAYKATVRKRVVLQCQGNLDPAQAQDDLYITVTWSKVSGSGNNLTCTNLMAGTSTSDDDDRATCSYDYKEEECFYHEPNEEERLSSTSQATIRMKLTIDDVQREDFGNYTVEMKSIFGGSKPVSETIILSENDIPWLTSKAALLATCGIVLIVFFMLTFVLFWWRVPVKVHYRRRFGACSRDDREYGAYFSYHFSYELDTFAQNEVRDVISVVRDKLECQGYKIYDEAKDSCEIGPIPQSPQPILPSLCKIVTKSPSGTMSAQLRNDTTIITRSLKVRAEKAISFMKQSHRVVIILTAEYVKDHWGIFTLQKGFDEMIRTESKLIFILLPGVRQYIKQHAAKDQTFRMVYRAMKLNYTIEWSSNKRFDTRSFSHLLELAMPKLRPYTVSRHTSTSSSMSSQQVHYKNGYQRTISNETATTEIGSPVEMDEEKIVEFSVNF